MWSVLCTEHGFFSEHLVIGIWNNNQAKQIIWQSKDVIQYTVCAMSKAMYTIHTKREGTLFIHHSVNWKERIDCRWFFFDI